MNKNINDKNIDETLENIEIDAEKALFAKSLGNRIKYRRKALGISAEYIAKVIGVSRASMYRYEHPDNDSIDSVYLEKLAEILKTSREYILGQILDPDKDPNEWVDENGIPLSKVVFLPIIGTVRAGVGGIAYEESIGQEFAEANELKGHSKDDFFWLRVKGDSMEPRLFEGDLVLVRKQTSVDSGTYAVVLVDDEEGVVKRVTYDETSITLHSQNHNYPPRVFKDREVLRIRVVGQVIRSQSKF